MGFPPVQSSGLFHRTIQMLTDLMMKIASFSATKIFIKWVSWMQAMFSLAAGYETQTPCKLDTRVQLNGLDGCMFFSPGCRIYF